MLVQTAYAVWSGSYVFARGPGPRSSGWVGVEIQRLKYNVSLVADTYGVLLIVLLSKWFSVVGPAEDKGSLTLEVSRRRTGGNPFRGGKT